MMIGDEGFNFHGAAALRAKQRVQLEDLFHEPSPVGRWFSHRLRQLVVNGLDGASLRRPSGPSRVGAEEAGGLLPGVGDVLRQLCQKLKRAESSGGGRPVLKGEVLNGGIPVLLDNPEPLVRERAFLEVTGEKEEALCVCRQDGFTDKDVKA